MARADRLERLDSRREELETEYEECLIAALRKAAAGSWGLFDHTPDKTARAVWKATVTDLCDRGQEIDEMRGTLGLEPFALHAEFEASRGPVPATAPGEPKQARAWLDRLGVSAYASILCRGRWTGYTSYTVSPTETGINPGMINTLLACGQGDTVEGLFFLDLSKSEMRLWCLAKHGKAGPGRKTLLFHALVCRSVSISCPFVSSR